MKKILFIAIIVTASCAKESKITLIGKYTETSPNSGGIQLEFIDIDTVAKQEGPYRDVFTYKINDGAISLTLIGDKSPGTKLEIQLISNSKFVIENLDASIPEAPKKYMTFEKQ